MREGKGWRGERKVGFVDVVVVLLESRIFFFTRRWICTGFT